MGSRGAGLLPSRACIEYAVDLPGITGAMPTMSISIILIAAIAGLIVITGVVVLIAQMSSKEER